MATQETKITSTPKDIISDLSLATDTTYQVRNAGNGNGYGGVPILTWAADADVDEVDLKAKLGVGVMQPPHWGGASGESSSGGSATLKPEANGRLYAWTLGGPAYLSVDEAP